MSNNKFSPLQEENEIKIDFIDNLPTHEDCHRTRIFLRSATNHNTEYFLDPAIKSVKDFKADVNLLKCFRLTNHNYNITIYITIISSDKKNT